MSGGIAEGVISHLKLNPAADDEEGCGLETEQAAEGIVDTRERVTEGLEKIKELNTTVRQNLDTQYAVYNKLKGFEDAADVIDIVCGIVLGVISSLGLGISTTVLSTKLAEFLNYCEELEGVAGTARNQAGVQNAALAEINDLIDSLNATLLSTDTTMYDGIK